MIPSPHLTDFASLNPILVLLIGALVLLLVETFAENAAKIASFPLALVTLTAAGLATFYAPVSTNPLLTPWIAFDPLSRTLTLLFLGMGIGVSFLTAAFFKRFIATRGEFYFFLLSATIGLVLVGASANFLTLFLGLETLSISLYILCNYMKQWPISQESAIKFFLTGSIAAAVLLYGIALIYGATGTTEFSQLLPAYQSLTESTSKTLFLTGIALVTLAFGFKAAVFPFHQWAPDVYAGAPNPVTAFLAVASKAGAFAAFIRVFLVALPDFNPLWSEMLVWIAIPTLLYANYLALRQTELRRFFAYSGISHAGFLLLPLIAGGPEAIPSLLFYLAVYSFATLGAFSVMASLDRNPAGASFNDIQGLFHRCPVAAGVFALCLLTLAGIPPTPGFFAKFYLFKVAYQTGHHFLVVVALLTTILAAYYYLRLIALLFSRSEEPAHEDKGMLWTAILTGSFCGLAIVVLTFFPDMLMSVFTR